MKNENWHRFRCEKLWVGLTWLVARGCRAGWVLAICLVLLPALLSGQGTVIVSSSAGPEVVGYVNAAYVIDSDADVAVVGYNRNLIPLRISVTFSTGSTSFIGGTYRAQFRLIDTTTEEAVPLVGGTNGGVAINSSSQSVSVRLLSPQTVEYNVSVAPNAKLDAARTYRVEARIQELVASSPFAFWDTRSTFESSIAHKFYHFRGTREPDAAFNVIAEVTSVSVSQRWLVESDPDNRHFKASVSFTLLRYDDPTLPLMAEPDPVFTRFNLELLARDSGGNITVIPLEQNLLFPEGPAVAIEPYASNVNAPFQRPRVASFTRTLSFRIPDGVPLDSYNYTYGLRVGIAHVERFEAFTPIFQQGNQFQMAVGNFGRLAKFTGNLRFGDIDTVMQSVTSADIAGMFAISQDNHWIAMVLAPQGGVIPTAPGYTYGGAFSVRLFATGDAAILSNNTVVVEAPPEDGEISVAGVTYYPGQITLSSLGARVSQITVRLPPGMGVGRERRDLSHLAVLALQDVALNPMMRLAADEYKWYPEPGDPPTFFVAEESKPVVIEVDEILWRVSQGRFELPPVSSNAVYYVREKEVADQRGLEAEAAAIVGVTANELVKPSNALYWRLVTGVDTSPVPYISAQALTGNAQLTANFTLGGADPVQLRFHFPQRAFIVAESGRVEVVRDRVVPANSYVQLSSDSTSLLMSVFADCVNPNCGSGSEQIIQLSPTGGRMHLTEEGGLYAEGTLAGSGFMPRWGAIPSMGTFAHRINTPFTQGRVHIPGHFMRGTVMSNNPFFAPANILLSGVDNDTGNLTERLFGTSSQQLLYQVVGGAEYAGLNLRAGEGPAQGGSGRMAISVLGGGEYGPYELKNRSKYYLRRSGLSGVHDKVVTSPETVFINGYNFTLLNFGLSFLSNVNEDSRTEGSIKLPHPSDFTLDFERLRFLCNGALDRADIKGGLQTITTAYWASEWEVASMDFVRNDSLACDPGAPGAANLRLGVTAYAAHVRDPLEGFLGVYPTGNLIPQAGGVDGLDSRLVGPSQVQMRGPRKGTSNSFETYYFTPTTGFYFNIAGSAANNYAFPAAPGSIPTGAPPVGFVNVAGLLRVSFFQALEAHLQMPSFRPPPEGEPPGDWGSAQLFVANGKWDGGTFFGTAYHDTHNRGFPGTTAAQLNTYRTSEDFAMRAQQGWLNGAISFDFPVRWDFPTRSLRSTRPVKEDFVVINTEQRIAYLSAERADVRFGAQIGLPQINLVNFVVNELTEATGIGAAVQSVLGNSILAPLTTGLDRINEVLSNNPTAHYERLLGSQLDTFVNTVYQQLLQQWGTTSWTGNPGDVINQQFSASVAGSGAWGQVWTRLTPTTQAAVINSAIDSYISGIDALTHPSSGLLRPSGPDASALVRNLVRTLIQQLAGEIAGNIAGVVAGSSVQQLNSLIAPHLAEAEPSLQDLRVALLEIRTALEGVKARLNAGSDWFQQLNNLAVDARIDEFVDIHASIRQELANYLNGFNASNRFNLANPDLVKQRIRSAMFNRLIGSKYTGHLKTSMRHRLFDLNETTQGVVSSTFGIVNEVVKASLTGIFIDLDTGFGGVLGAFSGSMAMAGINGHALFQGDSLRQVRMDAKVQWTVPNPSSFGGFLEINQYQSGTNSTACSDSGVDAAEVIIGAVNVPFDFLSPGMRINATTKFSFEITNGKMRPVGFAGMVVMTSGEVAFEAFAVTDFGVAVAFGKDENYFSAALGLRFNSYRAKGGVFFGKTCNLFPIMMWDMFVASALGEPDPTFSGVYVYGEAQIPVTEAILGIPATCFFQVNAGMGMGIFFFVEGPTYGARGKLSVSGEAFCVFNIGGEVNFVGLKQGNTFRLRGQGSFYVEIGPCPFCFKGYKTVSMTAETGGGKAKGKKPTSN